MKSEDAGRVLADVLREYMQDMGIQNGITELGFSREDIPALVQGALPQVFIEVIPLYVRMVYKGIGRYLFMETQKTNIHYMSIVC